MNAICFTSGYHLVSFLFKFDFITYSAPVAIKILLQYVDVIMGIVSLFQLKWKQFPYIIYPLVVNQYIWSIGILCCMHENLWEIQYTEYFKSFKSLAKLSIWTSHQMSEVKHQGDMSRCTDLGEGLLVVLLTAVSYSSILFLWGGGKLW